MIAATLLSRQASACLERLYLLLNISPDLIRAQPASVLQHGYPEDQVNEEADK